MKTHALSIVIALAAGLAIGYFAEKAHGGSPEQQTTTQAPGPKSPPPRHTFTPACYPKHKMGGNCSGSNDKVCELTYTDLVNEAQDPNHDQDPNCVIHVSNSNASQIVISDPNSFSITFTPFPNSPQSCQGIASPFQNMNSVAGPPYTVTLSKLKQEARGCMFSMKATQPLTDKTPATQGDPHIYGDQ